MYSYQIIFNNCSSYTIIWNHSGDPSVFKKKTSKKTTSVRYVKKKKWYWFVENIHYNKQKGAYRLSTKHDRRAYYFSVSSDRRPPHTFVIIRQRRRVIVVVVEPCVAASGKPDLRLFVRRQRGGYKSGRALAVVRGTINAAAQPPSILSRFSRYFIYIIIRRRRYYYLLAR